MYRQAIFFQMAYIWESFDVFKSGVIYFSFHDS